ncbi:DExH-box ATP-dependent RNA helicase DExH6-like [Aristolochia californica]|uniref:DExH-box ATP-dependent RNA helicase DExH6-like n=1 Tax=Aristolochia californica TaxID=171875 RepID=UPI0035E1D56F
MGRRQKMGMGLQEKSLNVSETVRIQISKRLEKFRAGDAEVLTFESTLSNPERAVVHEICKKMGMESKSSGRGNNRCVSVYKNKMKQDPRRKEKEDVSYLAFSEASMEVLRDLFIHYPPVDGELSEETRSNLSRKVSKIGTKNDSSFSKPSMTKEEIAKKLESLTSRVNKDPQLRQTAQEQARLPIASFKDVITSAAESNQVLLITGETGCGKTTQVPQFLLDHLWSKGEVCKIVCTQPRRISAISVAERISYERGESVGDSVGYKIRLESKGGKQSSIMFCTNGVLLRMLIDIGGVISKSKAENKSLKDINFGITHIIVDEIHERDRFADFMLAILRDLLPSCPHLRLILMSATLDADHFSQYFGGCPIIRVPGFTYPVKTFYLEDVLAILSSAEDNHLYPTDLSGPMEDTELNEDYRTALDEAIELAWSSDEFDPLLELVSTKATSKILNYQHSITGASPLMIFSGKGRVGDVCMLLSYGVDCYLCAKDGSIALDYAQIANQDGVVEVLKKHMGNSNSESEEKQQLLEKYLSSINPEHIDTILIERLLRKICLDSSEGAVLVFLPGWDDINQTRERLLCSPFFKDSSKFIIISLHSMIPSVEQKKVFRRPGPGVRKIILSTNIAETAVTIDDVVYVIDSGRMKEKSYDPYNNVSTLHSSWVSKASASQREGRAGRCQPGICYHLFSRTRAASLPDFQIPEIKRMPIEELCLQVKLLDPDCKIVDYIQKTLDPPVLETIRNGIIVLQDIGAVTHDEQLTELGRKLGSLPVHPSISKMLLFAVLMNCLDPALTLACASDYRDPFLLPMAPDEKKRAAAAKSELASLYGGNSDQLTVIAAFECWRRAKDKGLEAQFCSRYFVSKATMNMLFGMRKQLLNELLRNGFIPEEFNGCSLNAQDPGILHAVLVAGLYPMVGRLLPPIKKNRRAIVETASGAKVRLHPHSSNFKLSFANFSSCPLIVYDEITRGDGGMYIKNCSMVGPYPLLLLATEMVVAPADEDGNESDDDEDSGSEEDDEVGEGTSASMQQERIMSSADNTVAVVADRWLKFQATALDVAQLYCLRERLSAAILFKVKHPREDLPPALGASIYAIICLLSFDGLSGISSALESVESITSMVNAAGIGKPLKGKFQRQDSVSGFLRSIWADDRSSHHHAHFRKSQMAQSVQLPRNDSPGHSKSPIRRSKTPGVLRQGSGGPLPSSGDSFKRRRGIGASSLTNQCSQSYGEIMEVNHCWLHHDAKV